MRLALIISAFFCLVGMSTCTISIWSYDKASNAERATFIEKETMKLARKRSVRQTLLSRIFEVQGNGSSRTGEVQILLDVFDGDNFRSSIAKKERIQSACKDYLRTGLAHNEISTTVVLRRATSSIKMDGSATAYDIKQRSQVLDRYKLTPDICKQELDLTS